MHLPVRIIDQKENIVSTIHTNPDPYMIRWKDRYYCYSSGNDGIKVLYSNDLELFTEFKYAYENEEEYSYWAPAVFEWKGKFYLYYSSMKKGEIDDHLHFLRVAESDNPIGPFEYKADITDYFAIDPHVIQRNEKKYIFFAANINENIENGRIGTTVWIDELITPFKMSGKTKPIIYPTIDEEIFARNRFGDGRDWHTIEGPFYLSDGEKSWLMYSGNAFTSPDYFIGYATGRAQDDLCKTTWQKHPDDTTYEPLVRQRKYIEGTGHNSITQAPDHITPIIVYHGRINGGKTDEQEDDREMFIDYIWREEDELKTDAPSEQGIKTLPYPDIHYLSDISLQYDEQGLNKEVTVSSNFKIKLPAKDSYYLEMCVFPEGDLRIITNEENSSSIIEMNEKHWQRVGLLFHHQTIRLRVGDEWKPPVRCEILSELLFKVDGEIKLLYLDCTFLQAVCGDTPSCLL